MAIPINLVATFGFRRWTTKKQITRSCCFSGSSCLSRNQGDLDLGVASHATTVSRLTIGRIQQRRSAARAEGQWLGLVLKLKSNGALSANFIMHSVARFAIPADLGVADSNRCDQYNFKHAMIFLSARSIVAKDASSLHVFWSKGAG